MNEIPIKEITMLDFKRYIPAVLEEINRFKWLESEKAGYDIGEKQAARLWIRQYYQAWFLKFLRK